MNREELKKKLDVDGNGKVEFEDVIKLVNGDDRKLFGMGAVFGGAAGVFVTLILQMFL